MINFSEIGVWMKLAKEIGNNKALKSLFDLPRFRSLIQDPEFISILKLGDYLKLSGNSKFREFISDPEIEKVLANLKSSR